MSRHNKHTKTNTHDDCASLIINTSMSINTTSNDNNAIAASNINKRKQILTIPSKKEQPTKLYTEKPNKKINSNKKNSVYKTLLNYSHK